MKQLINPFLQTLSVASLALLASCGGGGSGNGNTNNLDSAPATLDATTLSLGSDLVFNFNRLGGDATNGGTENGFCNSFTISDGRTFPIENENGDTVNYDLPTFISNISYTYQKLSNNSGEIVITGDGRGDGNGNTELDLDGDGEPDLFIIDIFEALEGTDIFVNQAANGDAPFVATIRMEFGTSSNVIQNYAVDVNLLGTSSTVVPSVNFFMSSANSSSGLLFKLQDGNDVPTNYDLSESVSIVSATTTSVVPTNLSTMGPLRLTFDSGNSNSLYYLNGISSDDQGFQGTNIVDQGTYSLSITQTTGSTLNYAGIPYSWQTDANSADGSADNRGLLTIEIPEQVNADGSAITERSEQYVLEFDSTETGRFVQIQPDTTLTVRGSFEFPFADQLNTN